jgi:hypothetical protein
MRIGAQSLFKSKRVVIDTVTPPRYLVYPF